eukprot:711077-Amphidinium_carterae.1
MYLLAAQAYTFGGLVGMHDHGARVPSALTKFKHSNQVAAESLHPTEAKDQTIAGEDQCFSHHFVHGAA